MSRHQKVVIESNSVTDVIVIIISTMISNAFTVHCRMKNEMIVAEKMTAVEISINVCYVFDFWSVSTRCDCSRHVQYLPSQLQPQNPCP